MCMYDRHSLIVEKYNKDSHLNTHVSNRNVLGLGSLTLYGSLVSRMAGETDLRYVAYTHVWTAIF